MEFEIIEKDGDQVFWKLNDIDGYCDIVDGNVVSTCLYGDVFNMTRSSAAFVRTEVQRWLNAYFPI